MTTQTNSQSNIYRKPFLVLSGIIFLSTLFAGVYKLGNPGYTRILGYLFHSLPFFILSFMTARWAKSKNIVSRRQFVCRVTGVLCVYLVYLYMVCSLIKVAEMGDAPIGWILYPISIPFLVPLLYWAGYGVANITYSLFSP